MKRSYPLLVSVVLLAGCGSKPPTAPAPGAPVSPPAPSTSNDGPKTAPPTNTPPPAPAPTSNSQSTAPAPAPVAAMEVPAELKTDPYDYYGLGNEKAVDYELSGDTTSGVRTGAQTTKLVSVKDGVATFAQTRSGGLAILGDDTLRLDQKGLHVLSATVEQVDAGNLEFPAKATPGQSWDSHDRIKQPGIDMDIVTKWTVVGIKKIDSKRGKLDVLEITAKGSGTSNGDKLRMDTESYFAKGIGLVKAVITTVSKGKRMQITQQLAD